MSRSPARLRSAAVAVVLATGAGASAAHAAGLPLGFPAWQRRGPRARSRPALPGGRARARAARHRQRRRRPLATGRRHGHDPAHSLGASFREEAGIMRALGARDALNLDGGGSTAMAIAGTLVNR